MYQKKSKEQCANVLMCYPPPTPASGGYGYTSEKLWENVMDIIENTITG